MPLFNSTKEYREWLLLNDPFKSVILVRVLLEHPYSQ
jgi:hypothetical protein